MGCPDGAAEQSWAAWQPYERSNEMYWLENTGTIYALYDGRWYAYEDTFVESDPQVVPGAPTPPSADLIQPIRGFGKVWANISEQMGFGVAEEGGYFTTFQPYEGGIMLTTPDGRVMVWRGNVAEGQSGPYSAWRAGEDGQWVNETAR
jgi:hypothetical protein